MIFLFPLCCCLMASAPHFSPEIDALIEKDPTYASVNTRVYAFGKLHDTRPPKGYKPFYISHYGRHGSRSDWGRGSYSALIRLLEAAETEGLLTPDGEMLLAGARKVSSRTDGMDGRLTPRGVREEQRLAERMYRRYPEPFRRGSRKINSFSSTSPRCLVSMTGFTGKLLVLEPELNFVWDTGERFYDYIGSDCSREMRAETQPVLDSIASTYRTDAEYSIALIFKDREKALKLIPDPQRFEAWIYDCARITESFDMEENLFRFLSPTALCKWYDYYNMELYLRQGNSLRYGQERMPLTEPLVRDIVEKADAAIRTGEIAVDLRFGHDYSVMSLAGYLGIEGAGDRLSIQAARQHWCGSVYVCFASNIQLIFYRRKGSDTVLVKFLYNEEECRLRGLESVSGPYYDWGTVKSNLKGYLR